MHAHKIKFNISIRSVRLFLFEQNFLKCKSIKISKLMLNPLFSSTMPGHFRVQSTGALYVNTTNSMDPPLEWVQLDEPLCFTFHPGPTHNLSGTFGITLQRLLKRLEKTEEFGHSDFRHSTSHPSETKL